MYPGTFWVLAVFALLLCDAYIVFCVLRRKDIRIRLLCLLPTLLYVAVFLGALLSRDASQMTVNRLLLTLERDEIGESQKDKDADPMG